MEKEQSVNEIIGYDPVFNPVAELCKDDDYVRQEIVACRKLMGTKGTDLDCLFQAVTFVWLYCSENMRSIVESTMTEIENRNNILNGIFTF